MHRRGIPQYPVGRSSVTIVVPTLFVEASYIEHETPMIFLVREQYPAASHFFELCIFYERTRLVHPWSLRTSHVDTASFYYLRNASVFP